MMHAHCKALHREVSLQVVHLILLGFLLLFGEIILVMCLRHLVVSHAARDAVMSIIWFIVNSGRRFSGILNTGAFPDERFPKLHQR